MDLRPGRAWKTISASVWTRRQAHTGPACGSRGGRAWGKLLVAWWRE